MQPDSGGGFDLAHAATGLGGGVLGTFLTWVWRVARIEPKIELKIKEAEERLEKQIETTKETAETKVEGMVEHFREYFEGIRRQQDDLKLAMERDFVRKDDFKEFRGEYRENTRRIFEILDSLPRHTK